MRLRYVSGAKYAPPMNSGVTKSTGPKTVAWATKPIVPTTTIASATRIALAAATQTISGISGIVQASMNSDQTGGSMDGFVSAPMSGYHANSDHTGWTPAIR